MKVKFYTLSGDRMFPHSDGRWVYREEYDALLRERDEAVVAMRQILGWRELRSGQEFPIERIENIARAFLAKMEERGQ